MRPYPQLILWTMSYGFRHHVNSLKLSILNHDQDHGPLNEQRAHQTNCHSNFRKSSKLWIHSTNTHLRLVDQDMALLQSPTRSKSFKTHQSSQKYPKPYNPIKTTQDTSNLQKIAREHIKF